MSKMHSVRGRKKAIGRGELQPARGKWRRSCVALRRTPATNDDDDEKGSLDGGGGLLPFNRGSRKALKPKPETPFPKSNLILEQTPPLSTARGN